MSLPENEKRKIELARTARYVLGSKSDFYNTDLLSKIAPYVKLHRGNLMGETSKERDIENIMLLMAEARFRYETDYRVESSGIARGFLRTYPRIKGLVESLKTLAHERDERIRCSEMKTSRFNADLSYGKNYLAPETLHIQRMQIVAQYDPQIIKLAGELNPLMEETEKVIGLAKKYNYRFEGPKMTKEEYRTLRRQARIELSGGKNVPRVCTS